MRRIFSTCTAATVLFLFSVSAQAQKVGDKVVVISENVEIKLRAEVIDTTRAGAIFVVREVRDDQLGINSVHGTGFIEKRHVIPLSESVRHWSERIRTDPKDPAAFIARGLTYRELVEYDKAIADYSEALRLDPKSLPAYLNRGGAWSRKREYDKAIEDYTEAIRLDPKYSGAYSNRGAAWQSKGDHDKAIANYNEAIRLDPNDAVTYYNRGNAWQNKGDFGQATADYSQAIRLDPMFAAAYFNRGAASASQGDFESAVADYNDAIRINPQYARAYNGLAWILATCPNSRFRDGKRAIAAAMRACELDGGKNLAFVTTLAAAYAEAGEFANATKWQSRALELTPANDRASLQKRLDLYRTGTPYRDETQKPREPRPSSVPE